MSTARQHAVGSPSWFELSTTDQAGAKRFYDEMFGWKSRDNPMSDGSAYTLFELDGREVGACYTMMQAQIQQGVPPHWGVYFKVDDADAIAAAVRAGGGQVIVEPFEVMEHLRMAVCTDPEGAVFSLQQPRQHPGVAAVRERNAVCWVELATRDLARADTFYRGLFGWQTADFPGSPMEYRTFGNADGQLGGMMQMTAEWGDIPSHWSIYVNVADVDASVTRALALGGTLMVPAFDIPSVGRIARINDPAGAGFYVIAFPA